MCRYLCMFLTFLLQDHHSYLCLFLRPKPTYLGKHWFPEQQMLLSKAGIHPRDQAGWSVPSQLRSLESPADSRASPHPSLSVLRVKE